MDTNKTIRRARNCNSPNRPPPIPRNRSITCRSRQCLPLTSGLRRPCTVATLLQTHGTPVLRPTARLYRCGWTRVRSASLLPTLATPNRDQNAQGRPPARGRAPRQKTLFSLPAPRQSMAGAGRNTPVTGGATSCGGRPARQAATDCKTPASQYPSKDSEPQCRASTPTNRAIRSSPTRNRCQPALSPSCGNQTAAANGPDDHAAQFVEPRPPKQRSGEIGDCDRGAG